VVGQLPKEIVLYLCRDEGSRKMLEAFQSEVHLLPKPERPKLWVKLVKISDPRDFPSFLQQLEELYGGVYTLEFKKHGISSLPAVVIDGEKRSEGRYLSRDEVREILGLPVALREGPKPPAAPGGEQELPEIAPITVQPRAPARRLPEPVELPLELEEPEAEKAEEAKALEEAKPPARPAVEAKPQPPPLIPAPPTPAQQPAAAEVRAVQEPLAKPAAQELAKPQVRQEDLRGTCFTCLFFDKERSRCRLQHVAVQDPYSPPCGRRRPR
jgi:hypothetical protein